MLGQERLLGGVVEVAGEQHPDVPELEAKHHGVPVDRVGGAQGTRLEVKVGERLTLPGLGQEGQPGNVPHLSLQRAEHLNRNAVLDEEVESVVDAARQPTKLDRPGRLPPLERLPPHLEVLVHAAGGHIQRIADQAGEDGPTGGLLRRPKLLKLRYRGRPLHQPVVEHPLGVNEQALVSGRASSVSDSRIFESPAKWSASPWVTTMASIGLRAAAEVPRNRPARNRAKSWFSPPSIVISLPDGVCTSAPSPCWTSTNATCRMRTSSSGSATCRSAPSTRSFRFRKPEAATGWILPSGCSLKSVTSTSILVAVRSRTRTRSPQARSARGEPSSRRNTAKSTLIAKSSATANPSLRARDGAHRRPNEADADRRDCPGR